MTKSVRIENADTSHHKVRVQQQILNQNTGLWDDTGVPFQLDCPAQMFTTTIHSTSRFIVYEAVE